MGNVEGEMCAKYGVGIPGTAPETILLQCGNPAGQTHLVVLDFELVATAGVAIRPPGRGAQVGAADAGPGHLSTAVVAAAAVALHVRHRALPPNLSAAPLAHVIHEAFPRLVTCSQECAASRQGQAWRMQTS